MSDKNYVTASDIVASGIDVSDKDKLIEATKREYVHKQEIPIIKTEEIPTKKNEKRVISIDIEDFNKAFLVEPSKEKEQDK